MLGTVLVAARVVLVAVDDAGLRTGLPVSLLYSTQMLLSGVSSESNL